MNEYTLHHGDCLEYMRTLASGSLDAVVTDPPYGLEFRGNDWDKSVPAWIDDARRIARNTVFTTAPTTQWDYPRPDWVACWYRTAAQSRNAQGGFNHWTPVLVYGHARFMVDTYYSNGNVTAALNKGIDHPSPKDLGMVRWLVINASKPGDTIFDPFMGSGTTGVACMQLGRKFIGCEIDSRYFAIAQARIEAAAKQPLLFNDIPALARTYTQPELMT